MGFEELAKKLSPTVMRIAYKLNGRYRSFSHDDLYQEAMFHLWNNFRAGSLGDKTDSYILQGCYFHLKNYIRKINEKPNVISLDGAINGEESMEEWGQRLFREKSRCPHLFQEDCRNYLHVKFLAEAIQNNGFSPREKRILIFLKEGLTTRDIGKRIRLSHVSVVKAVKKIREKAKQHLDGDGSQLKAKVSPRGDTLRLV